MAKTRNFFHHLHPHQVDRRVLDPSTTLGLGIACLTCLGLLFLTGLTLFLYYDPDQGAAYERILHISTTLHFGGLVRNLHFLSANALLILAVLHLTRVFLTGSYRGRRLNWLYGLCLLLAILLANFTGYLLPWDQISYWAIKVGASLAAYLPLAGPALKSFLLGGEEIGPETLLRSFALHAGVAPLALLVLTALHLWRIRRDGGLALPPAEPPRRIPSAPWLYRAEGGVALLTLAIIIGLALLIDAPIHERADPGHPPNPAKAPWYFVGFQELVSHSALFGGVILPLGLLLLLALAPLLVRSGDPGGLWFARGRRMADLLFLLLLLSQLLLILVGQWMRGPNWELRLPF